MPKEVRNFHEDEGARLAFKEGIEAGFDMTRDVFQKMIVNHCKKRWWHRFFYCSCKKLLVAVSGLSVELHFHDEPQLSDDEPLIVEGE